MGAGRIFTGSWQRPEQAPSMDLISIALGLLVFAALLALVAALDRV
jgi:hypothetical protein